jgi:hypothetical protein
VAALNFSRGIFASFAVEVPSHTMGEFLDPLSESTNVRFDPEAPEVRIDGMCQSATSRPFIR